MMKNVASDIQLEAFVQICYSETFVKCRLKVEVETIF